MRLSNNEVAIVLGALLRAAEFEEANADATAHIKDGQSLQAKLASRRYANLRQRLMVKIGKGSR